MKRGCWVTAVMQQHSSTFPLYLQTRSFEVAIVHICSDILPSVGRKTVSFKLLWLDDCRKTKSQITSPFQGGLISCQLVAADCGASLTSVSKVLQPASISYPNDCSFGRRTASNMVQIPLEEVAASFTGMRTYFATSANKLLPCLHSTYPEIYRNEGDIHGLNTFTACLRIIATISNDST
jgi:hypothetical protein